jgi:aminopeptidase-like protein
MGRRGLYPTLSTKDSDRKVRLIMDLISLCDGKTSLLEIAERLNCPIWELYELIATLENQGLISALGSSDHF